MQGIRRKIVYVAFYELIAIAITTVGLVLMSGQGAGHAGIAAVASTTVAVVWNLVYNTAFEWWEARQAVRGRSIGRRIAHALGFEIGLVIMLVPLFAWWLEISLWHAFVLDLGLILFFLFYTFVYNLCFDRVFGLPDSARAAPL
ncbi:MAG: PACE efflux transporter [Burkholderiaceae bacterium]